MNGACVYVETTNINTSDFSKMARSGVPYIQILYVTGGVNY